MSRCYIFGNRKKCLPGVYSMIGRGIGIPFRHGTGGGTSIPPEIKKNIIAWYNPKKQGMTNFDVIESYADDFTKWRIENTGVTSTQKKIVIAAGTELKYNVAYKGFGNSIAEFDIKYTGNAVIRYQYNKEDGTTGIITINRSGIYHLPASIKAQKNFGFYCNPQTVTEEATIEQLPTSILKDFSGNKHDAYLYGFKGRLNSGVGIYKIDFSKTLNLSAFDNFERLNNKVIAKGNYSGNWNVFGEYDINGIVKNKVTIKITGLNNIKEKLSLEYGYYTTDSKYIKNIILIDKDGIYTYDLNDIIIPDESNIAHTIYNRMYFGEQIINDINLIVEEIPDYSNQLCYDGKSYGVVYDMPILTDYTIIANRTWFVDKQERVFISKATGQNGAFIFEYKTPANNKTYSYYQQNDIVIDNNNKVVYQTKNSYNGTPIQAGNKQDTDVLYIGNIRVPDSKSFIGCHGAIIVADRSFTEEEINWLKQNWDKI